MFSLWKLLIKNNAECCCTGVDAVWLHINVCVYLCVRGRTDTHFFKIVHCLVAEFIVSLGLLEPLVNSSSATESVFLALRRGEMSLYYLNYKVVSVSVTGS